MAYVPVTLERDGFNQPWGLRMTGGVDVGSPLSVSRVIAGTASEGVLRVGDVISAIKGQDAAGLSHQDASDLFKNAGNHLDLVLARGVVNGAPGTPGTPRTSLVDGPFSRPCGQPKTALVGKPPARKFSDSDQKPPLSLGALIHQTADQRHHAAAAGTSETSDSTAPAPQTVQSPTSYLPLTTFTKPKSRMELQVEEARYQEHHEKDMIVDQPYRTTPLITPGAKVKRDTPVVASYLNMHPDPQMRGAAPHVSQVATNVRHAAQDRPDAAYGHNPKIIHHQFNTPAGLYSQDNMANSIQQQTGISPQMSGGPKKEFSIQNSETLRMIMEEDSHKPAVQHKPKSHVVYDVHEAKRGVWPPPEQGPKRELPPPGERPVRQTVPQPQRDLPDAPAVNQPPSMFTNSDKIAQSYSFNKLMWSVDPVERL